MSCKRQVGVCASTAATVTSPAHAAIAPGRSCMCPCYKAGEQWCALAYSMPPAVATGTDTPAALPAVDESAAQHGGLDQQGAPPAALSPAQPTSEGRQHPRRSIDMEPAQVWFLKNVTVCGDPGSKHHSLLSVSVVLVGIV